MSGQPARDYPRTSVNQLCLPATTFAEDVTLARRAGYAGLGISTGKLAAGRDEEDAALFRQSGLAAAVCCNAVWSILPTGNFTAPADPKDRIADICAGIERLARFRPASVFCALGVPDADPAEAAWPVVDDGLRRIHDAALAAGTTLSVEPMVREGGRVIARPLATSVEETIDLFGRLGFDDMSVVVDIWHLHDSDRFLESLRAFAGRVSAVQMCDYHPPRVWRDRLMPGDGAGHVREALAALDEGGFTGWLDLEVFSDELWELPPAEFMARGLTAIQDCWRARKAGRG